MSVQYSQIGLAWEPGESMIVRRLPCMDCNDRPPRYVERRLCARCYHRRGRRRGLGRLSDRELFDNWTAPHGECLVWLGHISPEGYGKFRGQYAHRASHEMFKGPIPPGLTIDHLCRNRWCVNPGHLEAVTIGENVRRSEKSQRTHCPRNHEYDERNTYVNAKGCRKCRACARDYQKRYEQQKRAERCAGLTQSGVA